MIPATTTLLDELQDQGFREGAPAYLSADLLMDDIDCYRRMECDQCGKRKQHVRPFHRPVDGTYVVVCVCRTCGHTTEN